MTPEQQRIAIAEWCGWKCLNGWWSHPTLPDNGGAEPDPPDYLNDLNAMWEVEEMVNAAMDLGYRYNIALVEVTKAYEDGPCNHMRLYHATATQRAEALLRTLNLWKE